MPFVEVVHSIIEVSGNANSCNALLDLLLFCSADGSRENSRVSFFDLATRSPAAEPFVLTVNEREDLSKVCGKNKVKRIKSMS